MFYSIVILSSRGEELFFFFKRYDDKWNCLNKFFEQSMGLPSLRSSSEITLPRPDLLNSDTIESLETGLWRCNPACPRGGHSLSSASGLVVGRAHICVCSSASVEILCAWHNDRLCSRLSLPRTSRFCNLFNRGHLPHPIRISNRRNETNRFLEEEGRILESSFRPSFYPDFEDNN